MPRKPTPFKHYQRVPLGEVLPPLLAEAGGPSAVEMRVQLLRFGHEPALLLLRRPRKALQAAGPGLQAVLSLDWALAMQALGWAEAQAVVLDESHSGPLNALERWRRGTCTPWHFAEALASLRQHCQWTQTQLGQVVDKPREYVSDVLALNRISPQVRELIRSRQRSFPLTFRHLRTIAREEPQRQGALVEHIIRERLSSKRLEQQHVKGGGTRLSPLEKARLGARGRPRKRTQAEWLALRTALEQELTRLNYKEQRKQNRLEKQVLALKLEQRRLRVEAKLRRRWLERELRRITLVLQVQPGTAPAVEAAPAAAAPGQAQPSAQNAHPGASNTQDAPAPGQAQPSAQNAHPGASNTQDASAPGQAQPSAQNAHPGASNTQDAPTGLKP